MEAGRPVEIVRHVVFARPQKFYRAADFFGNPGGLDGVAADLGQFKIVLQLAACGMLGHIDAFVSEKPFDPVDADVLGAELGFAFAFGWTPCVGPILAVILGFAAAQDSVTKGIVLLTIYSLGLAIPFLLTSLLMERFLKFYGHFRSFMHAIEVGSGGLLIALGILLVIGKFALLVNYLSFLRHFALL